MISALGLVGTGRVAGALALCLRERGVRVVAVAGQSPEAVAVIAEMAGGSAACRIADIASLASHLVVAVKDDAIESVAGELQRATAAPKVAIHTSGATGPDALQPLLARGTAIGVLHPLQTIPDAKTGAAALPGSSWAYAGDSEAERCALELIDILGGQPLRIRRERWLFYHAAAVLASNYQVALVDAALELMEGAGVSHHQALHALTPLLTQTNKNVITSGPEHALTGPIRRGDAHTVLRHIQALRAANPDIRNLYAAAGRQTLNLAARCGLDPVYVDQVAKALAQASTQ